MCSLPFSSFLLIESAHMWTLAADPSLPGIKPLCKKETPGGLISEALKRPMLTNGVHRCDASMNFMLIFKLKLRCLLLTLFSCLLSLPRVLFLDLCPSSKMNFLLETLKVLLLSIWYNVESFIFFFVPKKKKNISGEVVLITGAGSGIGRLMAKEFSSHDVVLVLWDINQEGMKETARVAKENGARHVHYYLCDCSDKKEVYRVADQVSVQKTIFIFLLRIVNTIVINSNYIIRDSFSEQ